ncbi:hypothetical protein [Vibrio crassostreae]|uniref:hypothetical protein n=1 Tax=Vibrio crassostreae TaxID=246167 RepID=UPI00104C6A85|nr:hypothetical protein [Vibrio crassostreae]TCV22335.1 hypothetical protein EDB71_1161 [Vibrio crassostreae]
MPIYIGRSSDVVRRWFEHCDAAYNINHGDYNSEFKKTIRKYGENSFIHDILYVAKSLEEAKAAEANAIQFYQANLNTKNELIRSGLEFNYREIKNDHTTIVFRKEKNSPWDIKDREPVIAEAFFERGRIRLRSVKGQKFGPGLRVECSRESRKSLNSGEKIIINVKLVTKLDGSQYLSGKNQHFETIA